ncbi:MAG: cobalamin-binding protein [Deltaproteobacteria bacterium]|nr:cobalamin-binding protein [Candidatus Anaeroferrophillus wilburensis]MBN2889477.1 cobalamin-binding protein [Deltaproteobacteria bacterium]
MLCSCFLLLVSSVGTAAVLDELGNQVDVPGEPQRIISLVPSLAEILFALDLDERIVGVTEFATYPPAAREKPRVGSFFSLNLEKILSLQPDLVVASLEGRQEKIIASLKRFGIPVYRVNPRNLEGIYQSISNLGEITGTLPRAQQVILAMKQRVGEVERLVARLPKQRVFYQVGVDPIVSVNGETFAADLISRAGGILVTRDNPVLYPRYSVERVLADNPQVIIISSMSPTTNYRRFAGTWKKWRSIEAVRLNRVYVIEADLVDRPSPRIVSGLEKIARLLHPDAHW